MQQPNLFDDLPSSDPRMRTPVTEAAPIDADDRVFAADPSNHVVLEASAGTGKTRVLVERYVNLIEAGVDPRNILAITFTRKAAAEMRERTFYSIIKDLEPKWEIIFCVWGMIILGYKLTHVSRERRLFQHDFLRLQPGERIIPEGALERYKELRLTVEREARWRERLLPECILASLHRFHSTRSVQDAATAVRERAELAGDELDSSLGLVRYIAWAIPAIGFIGTVRGIGDALNFAEQAIRGDKIGRAHV